MKISCPHCHHHVEVVGASEESSSFCPACGSNILFALDTQSYTPPAVEMVGGFDLLERVGIGHFGEVWKARDRQLRRIVALKMPRLGRIDTLARSSFVREARAAARLRHPNIVAVHDVRDDDGQVYIVSEYVEGVSLSAYLREKTVTFEQATKFCAEVADALEHAHEQGIIHRDLKPANILIDGSFQPRLTDFGMAKQEGDEFTITVEGQILGTPAYMSPEQASGKGHLADARSDIYSLGVMFYEMLTGKRPFAGESQLLMHQIMNDEPARPRQVQPGIPKDLETICMTAMSKDPRRRYSCAGDFAEDLRRFLRKEPIIARPVGRLERLGLWCRRKPAHAALAGVVFIALVIVVAISASSRSQITQANQKNKELTGQIEQGRQRIKESQRELEKANQRIPLSQKPVMVVQPTDPPGAEMKFIPLNLFDGSLGWDKAVHSSAGSSAPIALIPGNYLVVAKTAAGEFQEVFRHVPGEHRVAAGSYPHLQFKWTPRGYELPIVRIMSTPKNTDGMVLIKGKPDFVMDRFESKVTRSVPDFFLDTHEVTVKQFRKFNATHDALRNSAAGDQFPMTDVTWDDAVAYAESVGKILPDEVMYEYAATAMGHSRFPWGDDDSWLRSWDVSEVGNPTNDRMNGTQPPLVGLFSGALEWTSSPAQTLQATEGDRTLLQQAALNHAIVRGGPVSALKGYIDEGELAQGATVRFGEPWSYHHPIIGFRCARSSVPRWERPKQD